MKIKWNGHASFTITANSGTALVTDPYESGGYDGGIAYGPVDDRADAVLISHEHPDHNHPDDLKGNPKILRGAGEVGDIKVHSALAAHDEEGGKKRGKVTLFQFEVDRVSVGFLGDLGHVLEDAQVRSLGRIDVLLLPVGGFFTIDAAAASKVVDQLKPRLVIPMHFKTPKCKFPIAEADDFAKLFTRVKKVGQSEIELSPDSLPKSGPEVWIMDFAR